MILLDRPSLGSSVIYFDENRRPHAAIVAHCHVKDSQHVSRPICNLAIFKLTGRVASRPDIEPAYHDGEKWVILNKYALSGEVPDSEWDYLPPPDLIHR